MRIRKTHAFLIAAFAALATFSTAFANPKNIPPGWKKVYQFNVIGRPNAFTGDCGSGNRLFVDRGANNAQILVTNGSEWDVTQCNATGHNRGELTTSEASKYAVFIRLGGKPGGNITICADTYSDVIAGETLCLLGYVDLTRGQHDKFTLMPSSMFDASVEDIIWTVDTNPDFRLAQLRVYEVPAGQ